MSCRVLQGDVFDVLPTLKPGSVDVAVTSPPYWKLRSYLPAGHPLKPFEIGQEATPAEYVAKIVRVCGLVRDALADHGTLWMNVGDTYSSKPAGCVGVSRSSTLNGAAGNTAYRETLENSVSQKGDTTAAVPEGNLCLIPQRLAVALQDDGWIVRSVVVWHKPAPMPTSVRGWMWRRCRVKVGKGPRGGERGRVEAAAAFRSPNSDHNGKAFAPAEYSDCPGCPKCEKAGGYVLRRGSWRPTSAWEPVIMLAKTDRYYCDGEAVKQPPAAATVSRDQYTRVLDDPDEQFAVRHDHETVCDGANLRDVWTIAAEPLKEAHYAAFPGRLVERCLRAATSARGYCPACGSPWVRVVETPGIPPELRNRNAKMGYHPMGVGGGQKIQEWREENPSRTLDWRPSCSCPPAEPRPGVVLDCFSGSGRTALVARRLGLDFVGAELNPEYADMSRRLLVEDMPLFNGDFA